MTADPRPGPPTVHDDETLADHPRVRRLVNTPLHMAGLAVAVSGLGMVFAGVVDALDGGPDVVALVLPGVAVAAVGAAVWRATDVPESLAVSSVFASVGTAWVSVALVGALPFLASGAHPRLDNALFESVSGLTTTGATLFRDVDAVSHGLLMWRAVSQWLGGMGVIVLAVAVLPFLGTGGLAIMRSELPGHSSAKLAPRVRDTARRLWRLYLGFTAVVTTAYLLAGMEAFDAVAHAFSTVSTGGFSTRTGSLGAFDSAAVEWIAIVAMLVAGTNFVLLWRAVHGRPGPLLRSAEARTYVALAVVGSILALAWTSNDAGWGHDAIRDATFSVVSIVSTTGFTTTDFAAWVQPAQTMLIFLMLVGAMTGSTAGGSKVMRLLAAASYARREVRRHIHPQLVAPVRLGKDKVPEEVAARILGFHALFFSVVVVATIAIAVADVDIVTSLSAATASFSNIGPGLGVVGPAGGFFDLDGWSRAVSMSLMLLGRLEIYPILLGGVAALEAIRDRIPVQLSPRSRARARARFR